MTNLARLMCFVIFATSIAALAAQAIVSDRLIGAGSLPQLLWVMAAYFTVLTNLIVMVSFGLMMATGRVFSAGPIFSAGWQGGLVLWIGMVGLIYHTVLAGIWAPQGLGWWADQGLHTAVPMLVGVWWLGFAPKSPLDVWHPLRWVGVPLLYCVYALLRGQMTGTYPYPFIDMGLLGPGRTAVNVVVLALGFILAGYGLLLLARILPAQANPS